MARKGAPSLLTVGPPTRSGAHHNPCHPPCKDQILNILLHYLDYVGRWKYAQRVMAMKLDAPVSPQIQVEDYRHGFHDAENYVFKSDKGLTREIVERISAMKSEPEWMRDFRLKALRALSSKSRCPRGATRRA